MPSSEASRARARLLPVEREGAADLKAPAWGRPGNLPPLLRGPLCSQVLSPLGPLLYMEQVFGEKLGDAIKYVRFVFYVLF